MSEIKFEELNQRIKDNEIDSDELPNLSNDQLLRVIKLTFIDLTTQIAKFRKKLGIRDISLVAVKGFIADLYKELKKRIGII